MLPEMPLQKRVMVSVSDTKPGILLFYYFIPENDVNFRLGSFIYY